MKKSRRTLLVSAGMVIAMSVMLLTCHTAMAEDSFAGGTGQAEDPWLIETPEQLAAISQEAYLGSHFKLLNDIDLTDYLSEEGGGYNDGAGWVPIGTWVGPMDPNVPFTGSLDGDGHTISNLYIDRDETKGVGLFGYADGAEIRDVKLENAYVVGESYVGSLVGYNQNSIIEGSSSDSVQVQGIRVIGGLTGCSQSSVINNSYVKGFVSGSSYTIGGLSGSNDNGQITNSYAEVTVQGDYMVGGLVGDNSGSDSTIEGCYAAGTVSDIDVPDPESQGYFGGLAGRNTREAKITDSYATGFVNGTVYVGGLVGTNTNSGIITDSYATGDVTGENYVGGLVGHNLLEEDELFYDEPEVNGCYARGSAGGNRYIGGLVGANNIGRINHAYSTGAVSGSTDVGGLIGYNDIDAVSDSYYDSEAAGLEAGIGEPKTTIQMHSPATYAGWDFASVWGINPEQNDGYPFLRWETEYTDAQFAGGTGEAATPYQVASPWQLDNVRLYQDKHFILTTDIDLSAYLSEEGEGYNGGEGWEPVGISENPFTGSFDGDGHVIENLFIDKPDTNYVGLFGYVGENGEISELCLKSADVIGGDYVGGLAGFNYKGTIADSFVTGTVYGNDTIGGVAGQNQGSIAGCFAIVDAAGYENIGGLAGLNFQGDIENSYTIGSVMGEHYIGGLVAFNYSSGSITDCYSACIVDGDSFVCGLTMNDGGAVTGSFWDTQISKQTGISGGTGKTTAEMKTQTTFTGVDWDFSIWDIDTGTYPYLSWQTGYYDYAPPVFADGYPQTDNVVHNALDLLLQTDENATAYYVVLSDGADAPTAAQIMAGTDADDAVLKLGHRGSIALTAGMEETLSINLLDPETGYHIYVTAEDTVGNLQPDILTAMIDVVTTEVPDTTVDIAAVAGVTPPVLGGTPVTTVTQTDQYTGTVSWEPDHDTFQEETVYTAVITLTAKDGFTFTGVAEDFFTVAGAETVSNDADSGVVTAVFAQTGSLPDPPATVNIGAVAGVTPPVLGGTPVTTVTQTDQYTGTVSWEPDHDTFGEETVYTAVITLTAKDGFTFTGVKEDFFTVAGAETVSNDADSGVVTAVFAQTESLPDPQYLTVTAASPANGAVNVSRTPTIAITFCNNIEEDSGYDEIELKNAGDNTVSISKSISGEVLTIAPDSRLSYSTVYTVTIPVTAVISTHTDANLQEQYQISFTTLSAPPPTGGGSTSSKPVYNAVITGSNAAGTQLSIDISTRPGSAVVKLDEQAEDILDGEGITVITVPAVPGVNNYTLGIPGSVLSGTSGENILTFSTEAGSITIPDDMLSGTEMEAKDDIEITIGKADRLPGSVRNDIGDRPVVQLILTVDGTQTEWKNPDAPVTVSIPYTPTESELADPEHIVVWYIDGAGNVVSVPSGRYDPGTGTVTFSTTHFSYYAVAYVQKTFEDLDRVSWAKDAIEVLASKGILEGSSEMEYSPGESITRADFLCFLVRTLGIDAEADDNFADISTDASYYKEIAAAKKLGITNGTGNNKFNPEAYITRQDMMVLVDRALKLLEKMVARGSAADLEGFDDKSLVAGYAVNSVASLIKEGLIIGSSDNINPLGYTTRAEAAVIMYRMYNR